MASPSESASEKPSPLTPEFDKQVEEVLEYWQVPGFAIAVVDGQDIFSKAYGIAEYPDTPVTTETLFYAGSTTKAFTAAAVSLLVDEREDFDWHTPLSDVIADDFVLPDTYWTRHLTFEDALSHRTGQPRHDKCYGGPNETPRSVVRRFRHLPGLSRPRTEFAYNNMMYIAVCHALEVATKQELGAFLTERIWKPLKMDSTFSNLVDARKSRITIAQGYLHQEETNEQIPVPYLDITGSSGSGFNISNVLDYAKWIKALVNSEGPISKAGHRAMMRPVIQVPWPHGDAEDPCFYGLGWFMAWYHGEQLLWHPGGHTGFNAVVFLMPRRKWGCVMFANNIRFCWAQERLLYHLVDRLLDVPEAKRVNWHERATTVVKMQKETLDDKRDKILSNSHPIPHSLPLEAYTGTYRHPAYQDITLVVKDGKLHADVPERTFGYEMDLEHVSGENFMAHSVKYNLNFRQLINARFTIDNRGKVTKLGLAYKEYNGVDFIDADRVDTR